VNAASNISWPTGVQKKKNLKYCDHHSYDAGHTVCPMGRWIIQIKFHSFIDQSLHSLAEASSPSLSLIYSWLLLYFTSSWLQHGFLNSFLNLQNDCSRFGPSLYLLPLFFYSPHYCLQLHTLSIFFPSVPLPIS
jgi:hypothetical protein